MSVGCICNERLRFLHDVLQGRQVVQNVAGFQGMIGVFGEKKWYFFLLCQSLDRSSFSPRIGSAVEGDASLEREGEGVCQWRKQDIFYV